MGMRFDFVREKSRDVKRKHGVSLQEAQEKALGSASGRQARERCSIHRDDIQGWAFGQQTIHDLVPVANTVTMYRTVHDYGHYPIDVDRIRARRQALRRKGQLKLRASLPL